MSPFWEALDKVGIALGILAVAAEVVQLLWIYEVGEDVDDLQEDVEEIQDDLNNNNHHESAPD